MIVDDDEYIRKGIVQLIDWDELGIEIVGQAESGNQAFALYKEVIPSIILTDIRMPDGGGLEFIKNVRSLHHETKIIILSGYDDFDYVRQAMSYQVEDYLLKPVDAEELTNIIKACRIHLEKNVIHERMARESFQLLRNNVLCRWVDNHIEGDLLRDKLQFLGNDILSSSYYQTGIISWIDVYEGDIPEKEKLFRSFSIQNVLSELIEKDEKGISFIYYDQKIIALFAGEDKSEAAYAINNLAWLKKTAHYISKLLKTPWYSVLGSVVSNPQRLSQSFLQAKHLINYIDMTGEMVCVDASELPFHGLNAEDKYQLEKDRSKIIPAILSRQREIWLEALKDDFKDASFKADSLSAAKSTALEWIVLLKQALMRIHPAVRNRKLETVLIRDIFHQTSVSGIQQELSTLLFELEESIMETNEPQHRTLVSEVETYIQNNYTKQLSLQSIADRFYVNSVHLGRIFKQESGEYFSDYINRLRMDHAKLLLTSTVTKINDIAESSGFLDPNYFFRKFKKLEGMSPTEYRNWYSQKLI